MGDEAERRVMLMINPGPKQSPFTLNTLLATHQPLLPGEMAACHRHTAFALRLVIEGDTDGLLNSMKTGELRILTSVSQVE